jgi:hypothetical protein
MNAKRLIIKYFTCIVVAGLFFVSCEKENVKITENSSNISLSKEKYDEYSQKLFCVVLKSLGDKEFKSFIKKEALKQFDGDYDMLIASALDKPMNGNLKSTSRTLKEYLLGKIEASNLKSSEVKTSNFLDSILLYCPLMQISVPELKENSTENWDIENDNILLTVLPSNFDEKTFSFISAFDKNGNYYELSLDTFPNVPVIVISNNERLEVAEKSSLKSLNNNHYFSNQYYTYYFMNNEIETNSKKNDANFLKSAQSIDRDTKTGKDVLYKGRFVSKTAFRQVEPWPSGRPEFKVIIVYSDRNGTTFTANSVEKVIDKDGWITRYVLWVNLATKTINIPIMRWYRDRFGLYMKYKWIEQDGGNSTEISTTLNNKYDDNTSIATTVKSTIKKDDDDCGEAIVEYEDPTSGEGTWYTTGIVKFSINQQ